jgi:hypothetical protein
MRYYAGVFLACLPPFVASAWILDQDRLMVKLGDRVATEYVGYERPAFRLNGIPI